MENSAYWRTEILKKAMAIHKIKVNSNVDHRCYFPPTRKRPERRPWPEDAGQRADYQP